MSEAAEPDVVLDALIAERGGLGAFSLTQKAVARRAAQALASDHGDLKDISGLMALLPPVTGASAVEPGRPWDLSLLSDVEVQQLERLAAKATGRESPDIACTISPRLAGALDLCALLDGVEDVDMLLPGERTDYEIKVRAAIHYLLSPTLDPVQLYRFVSAEDRSAVIELQAAQARIQALAGENNLLREMASGKVTSLAHAKRMVNDAAALAAAPTMARSGVDTLNQMLHGHLGTGDHPEVIG